MKRVLLLTCLALACTTAVADAIVVTRAMTATTIAEIFIEKDSVAIELEIGIPDLDGFRNLMPDPIYERLGHEPEPLVGRIPRFFREDLILRSGGGPPIEGTIEELAARPRVLRDEITGEPLPAGADDDGQLVIFARLRYPLAGRPPTLTIAAPRDESGSVAANIGFVAYHGGLPVTDFRYLASEEVLRLDWTDPWYSRFDNRNLRRQFDAPMSAFLYVEPYEVRKEIVLRPKDLQHWIDLGLQGKQIIPVADQEELKRRVADFLAERNPVTIDGRNVQGVLDRIHFIRRSLRKTGVVDPPEDLDVVSATLGAIFAYPTDGLPKEATLEWELFSPQIQRVPGTATDEAGGLPYLLSPDDAVLRWQNFLVNPTIPGLVEVQAPPRGRSGALILLSVVSGALLVVLLARYGRSAIRGNWPQWKIVGAAVASVLVFAVALPLAARSSGISDQDAEQIAADLLRNIYRAFDYRDEGVIYDTLERSAAGELLTNIYLETRRSLEIENQGGARAKVKEVEMLESRHEPLPGELGFVAHCTWNVSGSVGHWGHIHQRTNQYEAELTVKAMDGVWKITQLELLQEERL